ncbi:MAG: 30S ribosomal protein S17, partial [Gaiellaceae bacterium]
PEEPHSEELAAEAAPEAEVQELAAEEPRTEDVAEGPVVEETAPEAEAEPAVEEPVAEEAAAEPEAPAEPEPEAAAETEPPEPVAEVAAPPNEPAKPKTPRRPKAERTARMQSRKARARARKPSERGPLVRLPKPEHSRGQRKERRGTVVSNAMDKTIVVRVDSAKPHPRYKKVVRRSQKIHAHDEQNEANVGDVVRIIETRPLSKTKNWRLAEVVEQAR